MRKQDVKIPRELMDMLEAEDYLGWKPKDFFEMAIRACISITVNNMPMEEAEQFHKKYGDIDVFYLKSSRVVDC